MCNGPATKGLLHTSNTKQVSSLAASPLGQLSCEWLGGRILVIVVDEQIVFRLVLWCAWHAIANKSLYEIFEIST